MTPNQLRDIKETAITLVEERGRTNALAWADHCATRDRSDGFWRKVAQTIRLAGQISIEDAARLAVEKDTP